MELSKIKISNFKSIEEIDFDIEKYGNSYTSFLLGLNESGKSNVLQAMSFLKKPDGEYDYDSMHNLKNDSIVIIWMFGFISILSIKMSVLKK